MRKIKLSWAGHINRLKDDRWTSRVTTRRPYDKKRRQGRPAKRWRDDLDKYWRDTIWQRTAQGRLTWGIMLRPLPNHGKMWLPNDDDEAQVQNWDVHRSSNWSLTSSPSCPVVWRMPTSVPELLSWASPEHSLSLPTSSDVEQWETHS